MHVDLASTEAIRNPTGYFRAARERGGAVQWSDVADSPNKRTSYVR
jgi:hypothetical protein